MKRADSLGDFNDADENEEDLPTEETLELIADILCEGSVEVRIFPEFLREVADEIRALKKIIEDTRKEWEY